MPEDQEVRRRIEEISDSVDSILEDDIRADLLIERAHCFNLQGDEPKSVKDYLDALDFAKNHSARAHVKAMISLAFLKGVDCEKVAMWWAIDALDEERNVESLYVAALNMQWSEFYSLATDLLQETIELQPDHWPAQYALGKCLRENGRLKDARAGLQKYVDANPSDPRGLYQLGWTFQVSLDLPNRVELAKKYYRRALEHSPESVIRQIVERKLAGLEAAEQNIREGHRQNERQ